MTGVQTCALPILMGASLFTKKLVESDELRDELRKVIAKDREAEFKFGVEK